LSYRIASHQHRHRHRIHVPTATNPKPTQRDATNTMIGNHCFSTSPMQSSVTRHRPKQLRNAGRPAHNDGTRRGSSSLASSSSSPLAAAASASAPPPLATKGRKTSATPSRRGVVVAALLAAVFGSCPTGCSSLGVSRQPPRQPQRCGRQTGQRPTTKSTATTTATGGTPGIPFFRRSPSVPCAKAARGNEGEEDEEFSVEENVSNNKQIATGTTNNNEKNDNDTKKALPDITNGSGTPAYEEVAESPAPPLNYEKYLTMQVCSYPPQKKPSWRWRWRLHRKTPAKPEKAAVSRPSSSIPIPDRLFVLL